MDRWLPPRAPGANPPPRFDAQPQPPEPEPPAAPATPAGEAAAVPDTRTAPAGWQPPSARRDTPAAAPAPRPWAAGRDSRTAAPAAGRASGDRGPGRATPVQASAGTASNPAAVWALILGVAGVVLLLLSIGTLFVFTLPCSIGAWVLSRRATRQIERGVSIRGAGQAQAALWLGRIGVVVGVGAMLAFIVLTLAGFDFDTLRENLQQDLQRRRDAAR